MQLQPSRSYPLGSDSATTCGNISPPYLPQVLQRQIPALPTTSQLHSCYTSNVTHLPHILIALVP
jgi:hypothetical protein